MCKINNMSHDLASNLAFTRKTRNPRDLRKLCIMNPGQSGLNFEELRNICRPFGQMLHFEWNPNRNNFAFVLCNTEE